MAEVRGDGNTITFYPPELEVDPAGLAQTGWSARPVKGVRLIISEMRRDLESHTGGVTEVAGSNGDLESRV